MIEFIQVYSPLISVGISVLGFLVLLILRIYYLFTNKYSTTTASKLEDIYSFIPTLISDAEKIFGPGHGCIKLRYVLTEIKSFMLKLGYSEKQIDSHDFSSYIESILATPEKKGE